MKGTHDAARTAGDDQLPLKRSDQVLIADLKARLAEAVTKIEELKVQRQAAEAEVQRLTEQVKRV